MSKLFLIDERPAAEASGAPSAFGLLPDDLQRLGYAGDPAVLFGALQRVKTWRHGGPVLSARGRRPLVGHDLSLARPVETARSSDGSTRCVLQTHDGHLIEAVHMPRAVRNPRVTLCVSSQVGCAMGCTFCATGTMGIRRNLSAGEIVGQVLALMARFGPDTGHRVNLVFMGMGEPLHNLPHLEQALRVLCHPAGLGLAANRITVSTSGLVPGIDRLARHSPRPLLALSVNATTDEARGRTMPVTRRYPLAALKAALLRWPYRKKERVLLEYVLLAGVNDTREDAARLAAFAAGLPHTINLIPLNEHGASPFSRPHQAEVLRFADWLYQEGARSFVRHSRGQDVRAACGQLVQAAPRAC